MGSLDAKALARIEPHLDAAAQATVDDLVGRQSFDGVADFASRLPLSVVSELVGVSVDRTRLLAWGRRSFDGNGPLTNRRVFGAIPTAMTLWLYTALLNQARSRCPGTYWKSLTISPTCPDTSSGCAGGAASPAPDSQALHLRGFAGRTLGGVDSPWLDAEIECVWLLFGQRQRLRDKRHRAPRTRTKTSLWRRTWHIASR